MAKSSDGGFVKVVLDDSQKFLEALEELVSQAVFVGIPSTRVQRQPDPNQPQQPNNAVIGYTMENGDPARNIPQRAFLVPAVKSIQPEIAKRLRDIASAAMASDIGKVKSLRVQLGILAQRAVQQKITAGPFVPLSEVTLQRRAERKFGKGAAGSRKGAKIELARRAQGLAASTDFARPLIDTGQLRRSINYVIGPTRSKRAAIRAITASEWPMYLGMKK